MAGAPWSQPRDDESRKRSVAFIADYQDRLEMLRRFALIVGKYDRVIVVGAVEKNVQALG
jgi:hypothetical protein